MSTTPDPLMPTWMPILGTPFAVRCDLLDEKQALRFHGQSLARLADRSGLGWSEAAALAESRKWKSMTTPDAIEALSKRDAEAALAALRERLEGAEKVVQAVVALGVLNQDEMGGCVYCAGGPPGERYGYAGEDLSHHEPDCVWVLATAHLAASNGADRV